MKKPITILLFVIFLQPYFVNSQCAISNVTHTILSCDSESRTFFMEVDMDYDSMNSDSFQVGYEEFYLGSHAYADLPLTLGPVPFFNDSIEILIVDRGDPFCFSGYTLPPVSACPTCGISNVELELECNTLTADLQIFFEFENEVSDMFDLTVNGELIGSYNYTQLPYVYTSSLIDEEDYIVQISDSGDEDCFAIDTIANECALSSSAEDVGKETFTLFSDGTGITGELLTNFVSSKVLLYNIQGQLLDMQTLEKQVSGSQFHFDVQQSGIYFVEVKNSRTRSVQKIGFYR